MSARKIITFSFYSASLFALGYAIATKNSLAVVVNFIAIALLIVSLITEEK